MSDPSIRVALTAEPERLTPSTLPSLTIGATVTNLETAPVDLEVPASQLLVDGEPSLSWGFAIANGTRDERECALPPGEHLTFRRVMGAALFRAEGEHELVLAVRGVRSAPVIVRLTGS